MKTDSVSSDISRRTMLMGAAATSALLAISPGRLAGEAVGVAREKLKLSLFSKLFQWTDIAETAAIAREIGFDALDLTVRPKGHVLPERVATDMPRAVETVRKAGLEVSMISTEIKSVTSPYAEAMLKTASGLGIRHYRWGGLVYRDGFGTFMLALYIRTRFVRCSVKTVTFCVPVFTVFDKRSDDTAIDVEEIINAS
jgi:hypothetical protein